jgi:hypothetical protein
MTRHGRRPRGLARRSLLVGAALTLAGCALPWDRGRATAEIQGYRVAPGPAQIIVVYGNGPADGAGGAEVLEQSTSRVMVRVTYQPSTEPQTANLVFRDVVVPLDAPLGSRTVIDQAGREVPRR